MYLVDTSVWIDYLHENDTAAVSAFEKILDQDIAFGITGLIYQEVLQGANSIQDFEMLENYLGTQRFFHARDPVQTYREAAMMYFRCRKKSITIRSTNDCLIARIAIEHDLLLLHSDQDFTHMAEAIPELTLV